MAHLYLNPAAKSHKLEESCRSEGPGDGQFACRHCGKRSVVDDLVFKEYSKRVLGTVGSQRCDVTNKWNAEEKNRHSAVLSVLTGRNKRATWGCTCVNTTRRRASPMFWPITTTAASTTIWLDDFLSLKKKQYFFELCQVKFLVRMWYFVFCYRLFTPRIVKFGYGFLL